MDQRMIFESFLRETGRRGIEGILQWLGTTDFYEAPASTKYHGSYPGGLVDHSINVYKVLTNINKAMNLNIPSDTVTIAGLLHDVCKANTYKLGYRNVKNEITGQWEQKQIYEYDDQIPFAGIGTSNESHRINDGALAYGGGSPMTTNMERLIERPVSTRRLRQCMRRIGLHRYTLIVEGRNKKTPHKRGDKKLLNQFYHGR